MGPKDDLSQPLLMAWKKPPLSAVEPCISALPLQPCNAVKACWKAPPLIEEHGSQQHQMVGQSWKKPSLCALSEALDGEFSAVPKRRRVQIAHLGMEQLSVLRLTEGQRSKGLTKHEEHGRSAMRIQMALKKGCKCQRQCCTQLTFQELLAACEAFHGADDSARSFLIHTMYQVHKGDTSWKLSSNNMSEAEATDALRHRTQFHLCGHAVCVPAFCQLLGIGPHRLYKWVHGNFTDLRHYVVGQRSPVQSLAVDQFLRETYETAAEPLANTDHIECVNSHILTHADTGDEDEPQDAGQELADQLHDWAVGVNPTQIIVQSCGPQVHGLPRRYLGQGSVTDLYWKYLAWEAGNDAWDGDADAKRTPASFSTFNRVYKQKWAAVLKMRKSSEHSQCQTCWELRQEIYATHHSPVQKLAFAKIWQQHLEAQYHDRLVYWSLRFSSQQVDSDIVCIIVDGLDKKKSMLAQVGV